MGMRPFAMGALEPGRRACSRCATDVTGLARDERLCPRCGQRLRGLHLGVLYSALAVIATTAASSGIALAVRAGHADVQAQPPTVISSTP